MYREARRGHASTSGGGSGGTTAARDLGGVARTDVMLVLGRGLPEGNTAYVLVKVCRFTSFRKGDSLYDSASALFTRVTDAQSDCHIATI